MSKEFSYEEHRILNLFKINKTFIFENQEYTILFSGKPTCNNGEPKTDIYVKAQTKIRTKEFKISFKKSNADFLENKISAKRASLILGTNWSNIIKNSTLQLKNYFINKPLIYKSSYSHTEEGSITLGWKFELLNKESGQLSAELCLSKKQIMDVYAGTNLEIDKKNARINNEIIKDSGIANYIIFENAPIITLQDAIDNLVTIEEYVDFNPNIYFSCKALNYRTYENKYDGDRPLAVYVDWFINNNDKLDYNICFDKPLLQSGNNVATKLLEALNYLNIKTTKDINFDNIENENIIFEN